MNFVSPAWLWALPAALLPLLLHLLSRRAARRVPFPDLTLAREVSRRTLPRARLRELLLLAARCALLAALILAAAGPVRRGAAAGEQGVDLVLLLDASASMRARDGASSRFDEARAAGRRLLARLSPGDRAAAIVFTDRVEGAAPALGAPADAASALERARPSWRGTDAAPALAAAAELLSRSPAGRRRAVVVLGDGAAHMLPGPAPAPADGAALLGLRWPALPNAAVSGAAAARGSSARAPRLEARVFGRGAREVPIDLWAGGRRAAASRASPPEGGEARVELALPPAADPAAPAWAGRVSARADALPADDDFWFSLRHRAAPRVLVLHGDPEFFRGGRGGWFLREAFGGARGSLVGRAADFLESARWEEADWGRYGAALLADARRLPPGLAARLESFAARGGGVWLVPGARASAADLAPLSSWAPARFGEPEPSGSPRGLSASGALAEALRGFELRSAAFDRRFALEPRPGAATLAAESSGAPLLVAGAHGRGRVVVSAAPFDIEWTNLGAKPFFAAWVEAALEAALPPAAAREGSFQARVGESLVRSWAEDEPAPARVWVRAPGGRRSPVDVRGRRARYGEADEPGLYEFLPESGGESRVFAVNLDRSRGESDLLPHPSPPWSPYGLEQLERGFVAEVYGEDRRDWALAAAALFLALEMLLALPMAVYQRRRTALKATAMAAALLLLISGDVRAQQGDRFIWTQWRHGADWDPYPDAPDELTAWLGQITSATVAPKRRALTLDDPALFSSPFLYLTGRREPPELGDEELRRLRQYLSGGGFLWIEDNGGGPPGGFDRWVRRLLPRLLPEAELRPLGADHVLYRSFFLLRGPAGRVRVHGAAEGVGWDGRLAVLYTRDDALGALAKDALGRPLKPAVPGGEAQREQARRLALNVIMYSLTGSYKADAVHQQAILQKLGSPP